jgi:hypothetical protein
MNTNDDLLGFLAEWRRLTELEGEALGAENWAQVAQHQRRKRELRAEMDTAVERRTGEGPRAWPPSGEREPRVDDVVAELVTLELGNLDRLKQKQETKQVELARANETVRHLRGVRRAYAGANRSRWESYS